MAGPRHTDWLHVLVTGDRGYAAQHLPFARKLLGEITSQYRRWPKLGVEKITRELEDGTVVVAELHGTIPRVRIITPPPPPTPERRIEAEDRFVVWARDLAHADGIDAEYPQQLLEYDPESGEWRTIFYSNTTAGYEDFGGKKTTYRSLFPDGLTRAGNIDWGSGEKNVRVSWYGPSTRYWLDPHIQPRTQYGKFVFLLGHPVLDVEQYITDSEDDDPFDERYVMGAAIIDRHLYVMQADLPEGVTDETLPTFGTVVISQPWPVGNVPMLLCRYTVANIEHLEFEALPNSREVLWSGSLQNALNPWFFNESVTAAVSIGLPDNVLAQVQLDGSDFVCVAPFPSENQPIYTMNVENGDVSTAQVSLGTSGEATIAVDFIGDDLQQMTVERGDGAPNEELEDVYTLKMGALSWVLASAEYLGNFVYPDSGPAARPTFDIQARHILFADLRVAVAVVFTRTHVARVGAPNSLDVSEDVTIYRDGDAIKTFPQDVGTEPLWIGSGDTGLTRSLRYMLGADAEGRIFNATAGLSLPPAWALYQLYTHTQSPRFNYQGAHGLYSYFTYPAATHFGEQKRNTVAGTAVTRLDSFSNVGFEGNRLDFDGHYSMIGSATANGVTLYSGYSYNRDAGESINFVDDTTLGELTGIAGANQRFHPIWRLGNSPEI